MKDSFQNKDELLNDAVTLASEIVRYKRERPPADYLMKIESFSPLRRSHRVDNKYAFKSTEFVTQGYTWVLRIYPNGNKNDDGKGHLSLYLKLVDAHNRGVSLTCAFKFFLFDHKHDNYLVVQNIREKSFHTLKNEWGISRVLNLTTFNDPSQGFLMKDCCIFGVEISVIHFGITRTTQLSLITLSSNQCSYTWKIDKFSELKSELTSPVFNIGGCSWALNIDFEGGNNQQGKYLSLFLTLHDDADFTGGEKLFAEFEFCLKRQHESFKDYKKTASTWFSSSTTTWGFARFLGVGELQSLSSGFIRNDLLIIKVKITSMFLLSDSKPISEK